MKQKIINWLIKHERLHFIYLCIRRINDGDFVDDVLRLETSPNIVRLKQNGNAYKGKILYKIDINFYNGFCAMFQYVILQMYMADAWGAFPVVVSGEKFPYYEPGGVNGETNPWEYYFLQYEDMKVSDLEKAYRVVKDFKEIYGRAEVRELKNRGEIYGYRQGDVYFTELAPIISKYIRLRPNVEKYIESSIGKILNGKKTLGVQIRMGSMLANCDGHPIVPSLEKYADKIQSVFNKGGYKQIFLATDDNRALDYMRKRFQQKIVYYSDVTRVQSITDPYYVNVKEPLHQYKCGLEVLRDIYTLVACDAMVAGLSGVSMVARLVKLSKNEEYQYLVIVDQGINSNSRGSISKEVLELVKKESYSEL